MMLKFGLLVIVCACWTYGIPAQAFGGQFSKSGSMADTKPMPGYQGQGAGFQGQGAGFQGQGAGNLGLGGGRDKQDDNKGWERFWMPNYRSGNFGSFNGRSEGNKGGPQDNRRYRRDYGFGYNRGFFPGGGPWGPAGYGGFGSYDFPDVGYGSDNWRRE